MIFTIYIIILIYFALGAIGFYFINRPKEAHEARKNWTKLITYFLIINIVFFSIVIKPEVFRYLALLIILVGYLEVFSVFRRSGYTSIVYFALSIAVFSIFSFGFHIFSLLEKELILFTFIILSVFDSFSQITGQIWGKSRLFPSISPNKTIEGLIGGALIAGISAFLVRGLLSTDPLKSVLLVLGVLVFAFLGDIGTSHYKRKYNVKDFNNLIPGHGGFLDRFDSLIAGGAGVALLAMI
ncbi:MAG: phosphatidate cytidylyltransferase [Bacteroidetes bacterium]|nr:MAG: phosphatidate cytidylyltransferase [Bacteroidota bacterium]